MIDALYISASGLRSEQKQIDVISNNVANLQTPGFKRSRVNFVDVASASLAQDAEAVGGLALGSGTRIVSTSTSFAPGELRASGSPLDLALEGAGFFELEGEDGSLLYTRDGRFRLDAEGYLTSVHGRRLTNAFPVPADAVDLRVATNGEVSARLGGSTERTLLGTIELATFAAPELLASVGNNSFAATDAAGAVSYGQAGDTGFGRVQQGFVEQANVEMIDEMSALVLAQRAYQLNARVLQASDQILETINNLRR